MWVRHLASPPLLGILAVCSSCTGDSSVTDVNHGLPTPDARIALGDLGEIKTPIQLGEASMGQAVAAMSLEWMHTIPDSGGLSRLLLVMTGVRGDAVVTALTFGGAPLSLLRYDHTSVPDARSEIWYLINPATGTAPILITFDRTQNVSGGATSWIGIDPHQPFEGTGAGAVISEPTTDPAIELAVPSVPGGLVVDVVAVQTPNTKLQLGPNQTERWLQTNEHLEARSSSKTSEGTTTWTRWTQTGSGISNSFEPYAISAVCLRYAGPD